MNAGVIAVATTVIAIVILVAVEAALPPQNTRPLFHAEPPVEDHTVTIVLTTVLVVTVLALAVLGGVKLYTKGRKPPE